MINEIKLFLNTLLQLFITVMSILKKLYIWASSFGTQNTNENRSYEYNDEDWVNDDDEVDFNNDGIMQSGTEYTNNKETAFEVDKYRVIKNIIEVYPAVTCATIPQFQYERVEMKDEMKVYDDGLTKGINYTIKIKSITLDVCPSQVAAIKSETENIHMYSINPHVYTTSNVNRVYLNLKHFKSKGTCLLYTRLMNENQRIAGETIPVKIINAPVMVKSKPIIATVALILAVPDDEDCVWLGSLVSFRDTLFIVSETSSYHAPAITKLICVVVGCMDYTIKVIEQ